MLGISMNNNSYWITEGNLLSLEHFVLMSFDISKKTRIWTAAESESLIKGAANTSFSDMTCILFNYFHI